MVRTVAGDSFDSQANPRKIALETEAPVDSAADTRVASFDGALSKYQDKLLCGLLCPLWSWAG
jgi:hypothetical protein